MTGKNRLSTVRQHCLILIILALAVRVVGLDFGLPHAVARPDEETIVGNTLQMEHTGEWNPHFFSYPSLMIYVAYGCFKLVLFLAQLAGNTQAASMNELFIENPAPFHLALRIIAVVCGSLTPAAVYLAARRLFGQTAAILSGLIISLCYLHVRDSHFGVTDVPCVFLVCLAFWQLTKLYRLGRTRHLIWASVLAGLAIGTKYTAIWMCWPFAVAIILGALRRPRGKQFRWLAMMTILAVGVTFLAFAASSPYCLLDFDRAWEDVRYEVDLVNRDATAAGVVNGYVEYFRIALWYGMGWPVLLAALAAGLVMAALRNKRGLLLWCLPVAFYLYAGSRGQIFIRYMDIMLPFLAIACGWGAHALFVFIRYRYSRRRAGGRSRGTSAAPVVLVMLLLIPSMKRIVLFDQRLTRTDTRLVLRQWLVDNVHPRESILWSGGWSAMPYMIHHRPVRVIEATDKVFATEADPMPRFRWVVTVEWPVPYYLRSQSEADRERAILRDLMADRFAPVCEIDAFKADLPQHLFSRLDHFYMSFQEPGIIERPGPGFRIYRRVD